MKGRHGLECLMIVFLSMSHHIRFYVQHRLLLVSVLVFFVCEPPVKFISHTQLCSGCHEMKGSGCFLFSCFALRQ